MVKIYHRGVIKYLHKKALAPKDIHADMVATLGDTTLSYATVIIWAAHANMGKESLEDDDSCGRPTTLTTGENIAHVHRVVMDNRARLFKASLA